MYLNNNNLVIRQATEVDAQILCDWWADGSIMSHAGFPNGVETDLEQLRVRLRNQKRNNRLLIIEVEEIPIGEMSYQISNNVSEIGIKICNFSYQEKGIGTRALKMLINYLFEEVAVKKLTLDTNLDNKRAQHVYEKLGFRQVAVRIDSWKDQLGVLQSSVEYELVKENFKF